MMEPVLLFIWPEFVGKSITIAAIVKGKCTLNSRTGIVYVNDINVIDTLTCLIIM